MSLEMHPPCLYAQGHQYVPISQYSRFSKRKIGVDSFGSKVEVMHDSSLLDGVVDVTRMEAAMSPDRAGQRILSVLVA
jgi:hypothetical protein